MPPQTNFSILCRQSFVSQIVRNIIESCQLFDGIPPTVQKVLCPQRFYDGEPTLNQHWFNVLCLLRYYLKVWYPIICRGIVSRFARRNCKDRLSRGFVIPLIIILWNHRDLQLWQVIPNQIFAGGVLVLTRRDRSRPNLTHAQLWASAGGAGP